MNPYEVLGVKKDDTRAFIRSTFRTLSKVHHPDVGGDPEHFMKLKLAHEILIDPQRRKRYDETGRTEESRITPERVKQFLAGTFEGLLAAQDDIATVNVQDKLVRSIQNGMRQAYAGKDDCERKIKRAEGLMKRFTRKNPEDSVIHTIMRSKIDVLLGELQNVKDAIELAETAIGLLQEYQYAVDPAPEGPLNAGSTLNPRYGGRSSTIPFRV